MTNPTQEQAAPALKPLTLADLGPDSVNGPESRRWSIVRWGPLLYMKAERHAAERIVRLLNEAEAQGEDPLRLHE